jgi:group I intron endonuclease
MIIYKITNTVTGKIYIGQTVMSLMRRWRVHKSSKRICPLKSSIIKHGADKFIIEPLCSVLDKAYLDELEINMIAFFNSIYPNGYNLSKGGTIGTSRIGIAPWNKGLKTSSDVIKKISESHKGQISWNKGLKTSLEVRIKQSKAKIGKHISPITEFKAGQPSAFKGHTHSLEALVKISENGNRRQVECLETGEIYYSILDASIKTGIARSHLRRHIINNKPVFSKIYNVMLTFKYHLDLG